MTANVSASAVANVSKEAVWGVLADFSNIAKYTDQVKVSVSTSDDESGLGASRHCDLAPFGATEEKIIEFEPGERLVVSLFDTKGMPVKGSTTTFSLEVVTPTSTKLTMSAEVEPKGGALAGFVAKRLQKRLPKGAKQLVDDLARSAERATSESGTAT